MYTRKGENAPIKFWIHPDKVEDGAMEQIDNLTKLPFTFKHVSILPDTHLGYGMPIGGVLATRGALIPHATGVDLSCGMRFKPLTIDNANADEVLHYDTPEGKLGKAILSRLKRNIKVGVGGNYDKCNYPDEYEELKQKSFDIFGDRNLEMSNEKINELFDETASNALGTLGSGNHFIELQKDVSSGDIGLMIHTGSRAFGYKIAEFYHTHAKQMNQKWKSNVPNLDLSFLPAHSDIGQEYFEFTKVANKFASLNRRIIMDEFVTATKEVLERFGFSNYSFGEEIKCHHNFVDIEHHFGRDVYVHRKGAIRAREGDRGIIPGAMGSYSYIVTGKGNDDSFKSASHGAGRRMSRNQAKSQFDVQEMMEEFKSKGMFLVADNKKEALDEYHKAYKNIENVMDYQSELVGIDRKLETVGVLKG